MKTLLIRLLARPILWFGRCFLGWARLEAIDHLELGASIEEVIALYGQPVESSASEEIAKATSYTFAVGLFHEVVLTAIDGKVVQLTYWSQYAAPIHDLRWMLETYGKGIGWNEVERGYWYWRKDGRVRLWCSGIPAIGVGTKEYFEAKRASTEKA